MIGRVAESSQSGKTLKYQPALTRETTHSVGPCVPLRHAS